MISEPHITLTSSIILWGGINSFLFAGALLVFGRANIVANRYLAGLLVLSGYCLLHEFLVQTGYSMYFTPLIGSVMQLDPLFAPLFYLYVRELTHEHHLRLRQVIPHFIPAVVYFALTAPFYLLDAEARLAFARHGYAIGHLADGMTREVWPYISSLLCVQYAVYIVLSFRLLTWHRRRIGDYFSYRGRITLNWLRQMLTIWLAYTLSLMAFWILTGSSQPTEPLLDFVVFSMAFVVHYIGIKGLRQPAIYRNDRSAPQSRMEMEANPDPDGGKKYRNSALTPDIAKQLLIRLDQAMREDRLYLKGELALPELAAAIRSSPQYVSQALNEHKGVNFFDYVNQYRVAFARRLLEQTGDSILDIAHASGFNSKSAFYAAFKKHAGITPAQYRRRAAEAGLLSS